MAAIRNLLGMLGLLVGLMSCKPPEVEVPPAITLKPAAATLTCGSSIQFRYQLSGHASLPLTWGVLERDGGAVVGDGTYTAPELPGVFTVVAESYGTLQVRSSAKVKVVAKPVSRIAAPVFIRVGASGLRADVPVQAEASYRWSIEGGRLRSPSDQAAIIFDAGEGAFLVLKCQVTNAAGDSHTSSLELPLSPRAKVKLRPDHVVLSTGDVYRFGFDLTGRPEASLRWTVVQPEGGSVDEQGVYTAPGAPGIFNVQVSQSPTGDPDDTATVEVVDRPKGAIELMGPLGPGVKNAKACVAQREGLTYRWEISGGVVVAGQMTSCLYFTVGAGPTLTLTCEVTNAAGARLKLAKTFPVGQP